MKSFCSLISYFFMPVMLMIVPVQLRTDEWKFIKEFPDSTSTHGNSVHGLAVDPVGNLWVQYYNNVRGDSVLEANGKKTPVRAIYVYDRFGNNVSFSPITILTGSGIQDTLFVTPTARSVTNRGMATDHQGNILVSVFDAVYRLNYKTGEVMKKMKPFPGITPTALTAPAADDSGNIIIGTVNPGNPLKMFDKDFNYLLNVTDAAMGYSRSLAISKNGKDVFYAGYGQHAVIWYHSENGAAGTYVMVDTVMKGFDSESFARHPVTNDIWASSGSGNDKPNRYPGMITNWSSHTWYAYDPISNNVLDTIPWLNIQDSLNIRPRAIAFSSSGDTVYLGCFGITSPLQMSYTPIQMFVHQGSFKLEPAIAVPDTIHISRLFYKFQDTVTVVIQNKGRGQLSVTNISCDNINFSPLGSTPFTLERMGTKYLPVVVKTDVIGTTRAVITISSNSVEPVKNIVLVGTVVYPPKIVIPANSLIMNFTAVKDNKRSLTISNLGEGPLQWNISGSPFLQTPDCLQNHDVMLKNEPGMTDAKKYNVADANEIKYNLRKGIIKQYRSLEEKNNHVLIWSGGANAPYWSSLAKVLMDDGFSVYQTSERPIRPEGTYDVIFISEPEYNLSPAEISDLKNYTLAGGKIIEMSDSYFECINPFLSEFGITRTYGGSTGPVISSHEIFRGVGSMTLDGNNWDNHLLVTPPSIPISSCKGMSIASISSDNGLLVLGDDSPFSDLTGALSDPDNMLLLHNIIVWIRSGISSWVTISPMNGVIAPNDSQMVTLVVDAAKLRFGEYMEELYLNHNDPRYTSIPISVSLSNPTGIPGTRSLPLAFNLCQNYPNPFNPTTTIRYALPSSANVKIAVYDLLGREIATLVNEELSAGWKEVGWNGSAFSSGIYFYNLQAGGFAEVKKLMLLK